MADICVPCFFGSVGMVGSASLHPPYRYQLEWWVPLRFTHPTDISWKWWVPLRFTHPTDIRNSGRPPRFQKPRRSVKIEVC